MPKDSQPDNKQARTRKANGQIPLTRENQNRSRTTKKQSAPSGLNNDATGMDARSE
ncbi:MAG: hypothetical protein AB9835_01050 [Eubacteriales bacterium]